MITSSSFRALQGLEFVYIYLFYIPCFVFAFSRGVPCSFTHIFPFRIRCFTLSFSFRRLFGARQLTARVSLAHVVMSSTTSVNTVPLEPNVVIANEVLDAAETDDTDHVEFDLDELKEQLGIDSILEELSDLVAKFCSEKCRVYFGVRICELFLCFVAIVRVRAIMLTSLFYVTGEFHRFLHRGRAELFLSLITKAER